MKLTVTLTKEQHKALEEHAGSRDLGEDLVRTWWGRTQALALYAGKLRGGDSEFRAYAPRGLPEEERERLKALAEAKGLAPARRAKKLSAYMECDVCKPGSPCSKHGGRKPAPKAQVQALKRAVKITQRAHKIALYDSEAVAIAKAKGDPKVLKEAGRDKTGRRIK